jgi:DNA-binding transcriptional LysR family regulator
MGDGKWPGLVAHFLFTAALFPVCAPALAKRLKKPTDLAKVTLLDVVSAPEDWPLWLKAARATDVELAHAQQFDYPAFALQAAVDGLGVAMARAPFVADDLAAGRLVRPFKLAVPKGKGWYLVHRPAQEANAALTAFRDWLLKAAR